MSDERTFEILAPLGHGGTGPAFLARPHRPDEDPSDAERVEIELSDTPAPDADAVRRAQEHAARLAALGHPAIVPPDVLRLDGRWARLRPMGDARDLGTLLDLGPLPALAALEITRQVADALDALHAAQPPASVPLAPAAVRITPEGAVRLVDVDPDADTEPAGDVLTLGRLLATLLTGVDAPLPEDPAALPAWRAERLAQLAGSLADHPVALELAGALLASTPLLRPAPAVVARQCAALTDPAPLADWARDALAVLDAPGAPDGFEPRTLTEGPERPPEPEPEPEEAPEPVAASEPDEVPGPVAASEPASEPDALPETGDPTASDAPTEAVSRDDAASEEILEQPGDDEVAAAFAFSEEPAPDREAFPDDPSSQADPTEVPNLSELGVEARNYWEALDFGDDPSSEATGDPRAAAGDPVAAPPLPDAGGLPLPSREAPPAADASTEAPADAGDPTALDAPDEAAAAAPDEAAAEDGAPDAPADDAPDAPADDADNDPLENAPTEAAAPADADAADGEPDDVYGDLADDDLSEEFFTAEFEPERPADNTPKILGAVAGVILVAALVAGFAMSGGGDPAPVEPAPPTAADAAPPTPEPEPAPEPAKATITVDGDLSLTLTSGDAEVSLPGEVAPGTWTVLAPFGDDGTPVEAGRVEVSEGAALTVRCDTEAGTCAAAPTDGAPDDTAATDDTATTDDTPADAVADEAPAGAPTERPADAAPDEAPDSE